MYCNIMSSIPGFKSVGSALVNSPFIPENWKYLKIMSVLLGQNCFHLLF